MAWIEIHQALRDHRKVQALAVKLDMAEPHVVGHLTYLWLWALDNAPDGRLPRSARIIARAAWWDGDVDTWVDALRACGWIDDEDGDVRIHDWDQYGGKLCEQRRLNADRQKRFRERRHVTPDPSPPATNVTPTSPLPNALENTTQENTREEDVPPVESPAAESPAKVRPAPKTTVHRIPDDFTVTDSMAAFAATAGLSPLLMQSETEKFLDHFRAKGERKLDWVAAWRNWMRRVGDFAPRPSAPNGRASPVDHGVITKRDGLTVEDVMGSWARKG